MLGLMEERVSFSLRNGDVDVRLANFVPCPPFSGQGAFLPLLNARRLTILLCATTGVVPRQTVSLLRHNSVRMQRRIRRPAKARSP